MKRIVGISGSLRKSSFNSALLRAAAAAAPDGFGVDVVSIHGIPLYNYDDEAERGVPPLVAEVKQALGAADGLLIATPEYNNSIPGVLKNAIDWLSRPPAEIPSVFGKLPVAIIGASPGSFGTVLAQTAWLPVLRTLGMRQWTGGRLLVSRAAQAFDDQGTLVDPATRARLEQFMAGFAAFVGETARRE